MFSLMTHLAKRWNDWCGDADMEKAIRQHLTQNGYFGHTAKLSNVRLVAVQRPGWLQVFRFEAKARLRPPNFDRPDETDAVVGESATATDLATPPDRDDAVVDHDRRPEYHDLLGLVKDDIRHKVNTIRVFQQEEQRKELFRRWSDDLICLRGAQGLR